MGQIVVSFGGQQQGKAAWSSQFHVVWCISFSEFSIHLNCILLFSLGSLLIGIALLLNSISLLTGLKYAYFPSKIIIIKI